MFGLSRAASWSNRFVESAIACAELAHSIDGSHFLGNDVAFSKLPATTIRGVNEASEACDERFKDEIAARVK